MANILVSFYIGMVILLFVMAVYATVVMIWDSIDGWKDALKWLFGCLVFVSGAYVLGHFIVEYFGLM